jgi:hypothetical protein
MHLIKSIFFSCEVGALIAPFVENLALANSLMLTMTLLIFLVCVCVCVCVEGGAIFYMHKYTYFSFFWGGGSLALYLANRAILIENSFQKNDLSIASITNIYKFENIFLI